MFGAQCEEDSEEDARGHGQFTGEVLQADRRGCAGIQGRIIDFGRKRDIRFAPNGG